MLLVVQFPFADARRFIPAPTNRLLAPAWPLAVPGRDFVRSFGGLERRQRGGVEDWAAEDIYCRATYPLRFYPPLQKVPFETASASLHLKCVFRRLLCDGSALLRLEYGFRLAEKDKRRFFRLDGQSLLGLVTYSMARPVKVTTRNQRANSTYCQFIQSGRHIAKLYLEGTTRRSIDGQPFTPDAWWVTNVAPLILIEHNVEEIISFPRFARAVRAITEQVDSKVSLWHCPVKYMGHDLGFWCLGYHRGANRDLLRRLRIHLLRLHAERECLKQVLRHIEMKRMDLRQRGPESDAVHLYLTNAIRMLNRRSRYGLPQSQMLQAAQNADDFVTMGERTNLLSAIEGAKRNLFHSISKFTEARGQRETVFYNISATGPVNIGRTIHSREKHVTEYNVRLGDHAVVHGDFIVANTIQNSFNKIDSSRASTEMKEQLKNLHEGVTEMTKQMDPDKAKEAARDLESFTNEVTSETPRQKWYGLSAEGLLDAAKTVGSIAAPVVSTVKAILGLLSGAA